MKNRNIYLYIAGACFFAMCGSLWNEYFGSHNSHLNLESLNPESLNPGSHLNPESLNPVLRASDGAERSERNPAPGRYYAVPKTAVESFAFDPNEADSTQLLRLGLTPAQVRSIYRHRAKGYVYSTPEDFARTPFMTKGQWNRLKPLIRIGDQYKPVNLSSTVNSHTADSLATVSRSVRSENQDSTLHSSLFIINLNDASFKSLVRHPFLSYEQVKAVKNFQRKYGRIRNMTELLILPEFTVEDTLRLSPYLQF